MSARSRSGGIKPRPPVGWAGLPAFGWFLAGLAGSALVASLVGIPPGEAGTLLAVITLAALAVVAAGLGLQGRLRRR
ncbi:MAG TPA: hypothetical protein VID07_10690, partial [Actinomycetes bacterium]